MDDDKETLFYSDDKGVRITSNEVVVGDKTYPMLDISTVSLSTIPPNRTGAMWGVALSLGIGAIAIPMQAWLGALTGAALAGYCIWRMMRLRPRYSVVLGNATGRVNAVTSSDRTYIQTIVHAMDDVFTKLAGRIG
jgi:hypothetical protein